MRRPLEFLFLQTLQPQAETRTLPVKNLDLIAALVREAEQVTAERIEPQRRLYHRREAVDAEPEIYRILTMSQNVALFTVAIARCVVALWIFQRLYQPVRQESWTTPTLRSVLLFAVIYAVVNTLFAHAVLTYATPEQTLTARDLASLFGGTIVGSLGGFVALNLTFTTYLSSRLKDD